VERINARQGGKFYREPVSGEKTIDEQNFAREVLGQAGRHHAATMIDFRDYPPQQHRHAGHIAH
jgi:hypothetical protein